MLSAPPLWRLLAAILQIVALVALVVPPRHGHAGGIQDHDHVALVEAAPHAAHVMAAAVADIHTDSVGDDGLRSACCVGGGCCACHAFAGVLREIDSTPAHRAFAYRLTPPRDVGVYGVVPRLFPEPPRTFA